MRDPAGAGASASKVARPSFYRCQAINLDFAGTSYYWCNATICKKPQGPAGVATKLLNSKGEGPASKDVMLLTSKGGAPAIIIVIYTDLKECGTQPVYLDVSLLYLPQIFRGLAEKDVMLYCMYLPVRVTGPFGRHRCNATNLLELFHLKQVQTGMSVISRQMSRANWAMCFNMRPCFPLVWFGGRQDVHLGVFTLASPSKTQAWPILSGLQFYTLMDEDVDRPCALGSGMGNLLTSNFAGPAGLDVMPLSSNYSGPGFDRCNATNLKWCRAQLNGECVPLAGHHLSGETIYLEKKQIIQGSPTIPTT